MSTGASTSGAPATLSDAELKVLFEQLVAGTDDP